MALHQFFHPLQRCFENGLLPFVVPESLEFSATWIGNAIDRGRPRGVGERSLCSRAAFPDLIYNAPAG